MTPKERHAYRMQTDPEYRERRRAYAAKQNQKRREQRESDPEIRERYLEWEQKRGKVRRATPEYREYRRKNSAKLRAGPNAQLYKDIRAASMRRYPEKRRMWEAARRARKLDQFIENVDPKLLYQMHGGMCGICEQFIEGEFHVDHVIPLSKGGMHGYVNTQPAHPICNLRKGNNVEST